MFMVSSFFIFSLNVGYVLDKKDAVVWTGLIWLRIGTSGQLLNTVMNLWVP
jgi:hypothetical protein